MANADALRATPSDFTLTTRLERAGLLATIGVAAALQLSIAVAQSLFAIAVLCWLALLLFRREPVQVPRFFWPLAALAALTLISAAFSSDPRASFVDTKQLLLFLMVPLAYRFAGGNRAATVLLIVVSVGAASAAFGIVQYGILHYDHLGQRPRGTLGHYMTYSGLLMLVIGVALAQLLFGTRDRVWAALVMPALAVAVALTFTRSAWVGACAAAAVLLMLKDLRLVALLPVVAAIFVALAPPSVTARFVSIFDLKDPTNRDRIAMFHEGERMIRARPLVGVGPNMVEALYEQYRGDDAVEKINPHLHNVAMQLAAERGLPALLCWLAFVAITVYDLGRGLRGRRLPAVAAAAGLAAMVSMLAAGLFEYNFGDSEFLMLLLLLITLPFAADRPSVEHPIA
ncbi:MAG: O-antigen ligase family protein [Vicinamibacterales bacterium]